MSKFKAGSHTKQLRDTGYEYEAFLPSKVNKDYEWEMSGLSSLLEEAGSKLAELNSYALQTPDIDFFIKMHVAKEATTSSRIEGTRTEVGEVFMDKEEVVPEKRDDWEEVQNYITAMRWSIDKLEELPLTMRLIKGAHKRLLSGVRGEQKRPGEIRESQNWIGGKSIEEASFIPPAPDELPDLLSDLEKFWHHEELDLPHLLKAGISHYQFETIHPFLDGNGRIGRLLITLYLMYMEVLDKPVLYLSDFFSRNRTEYFSSLIKVREEDDMEQWLRFFLRGVVETSEKGIGTLKEVVSLKENYLQTVEQEVSSRRQELTEQALSYLFSDPRVSVNELAEELDITFPTADALLKELGKVNLVKEVTGRERDRRFELVGYVSIFVE